jgi:hypothetical protein
LAKTHFATSSIETVPRRDHDLFHTRRVHVRSAEPRGQDPPMRLTAGALWAVLKRMIATSTIDGQNKKNF